MWVLWRAISPRLCHYPCAFANLFLLSCVSVTAWRFDAHFYIRPREFRFSDTTGRSTSGGHLYMSILAHCESQRHPSGDSMTLVCLLQLSMKSSTFCRAVSSLLLLLPALHPPSQSPQEFSAVRPPAKWSVHPAPNCLPRQHRARSCSQQWFPGRAGVPQELL